MSSRAAIEAILLVLAWAAALAVRPWRLLRRFDDKIPLATPFLASLTVLPWLWSWSSVGALPFPLHWSGAPLLVLLIGWPLAIPVLTLAGASTTVTAAASAADALQLTIWSGILPATLTLLLGHGIRLAFGPNPVAYMLGRGFLVPMIALGVCAAGAAALGGAFGAATGDLQKVAIVLLAMGEASWSCALVSLLVAYRPQWLATWSDGMYLRRPTRNARIRPHR